MESILYNRWLHRFAVLTVCVALVTLTAGALVTSKNAGMAFRDWPTSDGHGMLAYPWFQSYGEKFLEHGHRLAGVMIGCFSIGLCALLLRFEQRRWVKAAGVLVLLAVIVQGILGGFRVWLDQRGLAMLHGLFAAGVFSLMGSVAVVLSRRWRDAPETFRRSQVAHLKPFAVAVVALLALQYVLGGLVRHQGTSLHEHLGLGVLALIAVVVNAVVAHRSGADWLRSSAWLLLAAVLLQVALGAGAWVTKFGLPATGYIARADSIHQVAFRTAHTVVGIVVFMTAVVHALRVFRAAYCGLRSGAAVTAPRLSSPATAGGGAA